VDQKGERYWFVGGHYFKQTKSDGWAHIPKANVEAMVAQWAKGGPKARKLSQAVSERISSLHHTDITERVMEQFLDAVQLEAEIASETEDQPRNKSNTGKITASKKERLPGRRSSRLTVGSKDAADAGKEAEAKSEGDVVGASQQQSSGRSSEPDSAEADRACPGATLEVNGATADVNTDALPQTEVDVEVYFNQYPKAHSDRSSAVFDNFVIRAQTWAKRQYKIGVMASMTLAENQSTMEARQAPLYNLFCVTFPAIIALISIDCTKCLAERRRAFRWPKTCF
jgi:hypothetical protein